MGAYSFYESTRRSRVDITGISAAQKSYTYNYLYLLPQSRDRKIVDLGCSEGISLEWLLINGYQNIVGVDSDKVAIDLAKRSLNPR